MTSEGPAPEPAIWVDPLPEPDDPDDHDDSADEPLALRRFVPRFPSQERRSPRDGM